MKLAKKKDHSKDKKVDATKSQPAKKAEAAKKAQQNLNTANQTLRQLTAIADAANVKFKKF